MEELRLELEAKKNARDSGQDASIIDAQGLFAERDATFRQMEDGEYIPASYINLIFSSSSRLYHQSVYYL